MLNKIKKSSSSGILINVVLPCALAKSVSPESKAWWWWKINKQTEKRPTTIHEDEQNLNERKEEKTKLKWR